MPSFAPNPETSAFNFAPKVKLTQGLVSISPTIYNQLFSNYRFLCKFWLINNIGAKAARKMLVKLPKNLDQSCLLFHFVINLSVALWGNTT